MADGMREGQINELVLVPSRFQLARVQGQKRGVGQAVYDMALSMVIQSLADRVHYSMMPMTSTWNVFTRAPHRSKLMHEEDFNTLADARTNRCGLLGDRDMEDPVPEGTPEDVEEAWRRREYRAPKGSWEWYRQRHCACPGCGEGADLSAHCGGLYRGEGRAARSRARQTRWHNLVDCQRGVEGSEMDELRQAATAWLVRRGEDMGGDAALALKALQGGGEQMSRAEKWMALRFMLGLPLSPIDEGETASRGLAAGYAKGFLRRMCKIIKAGVSAAGKAVWGVDSAFKDSVFARIGRGAIMLARPGARGVEAEGGGTKWVQGGRQAWMRRRGLREQWDGREWSRAVVAKMRQWAAMAGPANCVKRVQQRREVGGGVRDKVEKGRDPDVVAPWEGHEAFDAWTLAEAVARWRGDRGAGASARRRLLWLRHAGLDPSPARARAQEAKERAEAKEEGEVRAALERIITCVEKGTMPMLRRGGGEGQRLGASRYWDKGTVRMPRGGLADELAQQGRGPLRGGQMHVVDRVLDVRRVGSGLQVLIRWRGSGHEDEWKPYAQCNPPSQREAKAIERIKFPARGVKRSVPASLAQVLRASARFAPIGGGAAKRLRMADGRAVRPRVASPAVPTYSPAAGPFGEGGGRSKRGLPILWEPPSGGDMRGRLWMSSPGGVT